MREKIESEPKIAWIIVLSGSLVPEDYTR